VTGFGHGVGEADEATLGAPVVAGREGLDVGLPVGVEGAHLRREADVAVLAGPVERLDPDRIADGVEGAVGAGGEEGVHAVELAEGVGPPLLEQVQRDLVVGVRAKARVPQGLAHLFVIVDLAVTHEEEVPLAVAQRLMAVADVDDRQAGVPEPGVADPDLAGVVGAAVGEPAEHSSTGFEVQVRAVFASYSAHS
jgi:hypothetical protein